MAFEDFIKHVPVISGTDYETIRIHSGEDAHTDNFNRSVVDSINRDNALESALTYLARSSSLFVTANTRFLSHCEGQGIDLVKSIAPVLTTEPKDIFLADGTFIGAAWPQRATTNMMMYGASDSTLTTLSGWTVTNPSYIGAAILSSSEEFTNISTMNKTDDIVPGEVVIESQVIPITVDEVNTLNKISGGLSMTTESNMQATATEFIYTFKLLNDDNAVVDSHTTTVVAGSYNGVVGIENIDIPNGATKFQIHVQINFNSENSRAEFTIKNVMVQAGGILAPYTQTNRQQCTCEYRGVIDPDYGNITAMCWSTFKPYSLATHAGPIGPLFIRMGNLTIGGVHRAKDAGAMVLSLYVNDDGNPVYGPEFTVPDTYEDAYLLSAVRIRPVEGNETKSYVEFALIAGENMFKSQLIIDTDKVIQGDIVLGTDYQAADFFNGPVTEVRYDQEWVNDTELYIISLAKKAFSFKKSNDLGAADAGESVLDTLDKVGVNLILNPTAKLAFVGWNNYPANNFTVSHNDLYAGNCFVWAGSANSTYEIISNEIPVKPSNLYTLRSVIFSEQGSSGEAGIGIIWYNNDGDELSRAKINMTHIYQPRYYAIASVSPSAAVSARVFMYVNAGLNATRLTWSRLKFEMGDATQFTDDSGAGYALYYI